MRKNVPDKKYPKIGDTRTRIEFLWWPMKINTDWRWLEIGYWEEVCEKSWGYIDNGYWNPVRWIND